MTIVALILIAAAVLATLAFIVVARRDARSVEHRPRNIDRAGPDEAIGSLPVSLADRSRRRETDERREAPAQRW